MHLYMLFSYAIEMRRFPARLKRRKLRDLGGGEEFLHVYSNTVKVRVDTTLSQNVISKSDERQCLAEEACQFQRVE